MSGLWNGQPFPPLNQMNKPAANSDGSTEIYFGPGRSTDRLDDGLDQLLLVERLLQIRDAPELGGLALDALIREARHENDRKPQAKGGELPPHLDARHVAQLNVHQQTIRSACRGNSKERLGAIVGPGDVSEG